MRGVLTIPSGSLPITFTGGKPLFTHQVHGEYMVGSETKYPAWTHQVHFDYILITFTIFPQFAHLNTHRVHVEYFRKVSSTEPVEGGVNLSTGVRATLHPVLPGRYRIQHLLPSKLD